MHYKFYSGFLVIPLRFEQSSSIGTVHPSKTVNLQSKASVSHQHCSAEPTPYSETVVAVVVVAGSNNRIVVAEPDTAADESSIASVGTVVAPPWTVVEPLNLLVVALRSNSKGNLWMMM